MILLKSVLLLLFTYSFAFANQDMYYDEAYVKAQFSALDNLENLYQSNSTASYEDLVHLLASNSDQTLDKANFNTIYTSQFKNGSVQLLYGILIGVGSCLLIAGIYWLIVVATFWY